MNVSVGGWWLGGYMDGLFGRWVVFGWVHEWMCMYVDGDWVDVCMDMSLVGGGCVDVCMNVSVGVWWLGRYMDGYVGRWVVVGWIDGRKIR